MNDDSRHTKKDLLPLLQHAWLESPLVQTALSHHYLYYQAVHHEQALLLNHLKQAAHQGDNAHLQQATLVRISHDLELIDRLNDAIAYVEFYTPYDLPIPLSSNKMHEILVGAYDLIKDPIQWNTLISGHFPFAHQHDCPYPIILGDEVCIAGTSQSSYISAALIETLSTLNNQPHANSLFGDGEPWSQTSAISQVTAIPEKVFLTDPSLQSEIETMTFFGADDLAGLQLLYIHNGYTFGGSRDESCPSTQKLYAPEDCSSWTAKLFDSPFVFTSIDLLYTYRALVGEGFVESYWMASSNAHALLDLFSPVTVNDPTQDIKPGQIMVFRKFESEDHSQATGYSGHVALVLGFHGGEVATLNYSRHMPDVEGFGISFYPYQSDLVKEVFFLEPNPESIKSFNVFDMSQYDSHVNHELSFMIETLPPWLEQLPVDVF